MWALKEHLAEHVVQKAEGRALQQLRGQVRLLHQRLRALQQLLGAQPVLSSTFSHRVN